MLWVVKQKSRGPRGLPCCTPSEDWMTTSLKKREDGKPYAESTRGSSSGSSTARTILSWRRELNAFLKSNL